MHWNITNGKKLLLSLVQDKNTIQIRKGDVKNTPLKNTTTTLFITVSTSGKSTVVSKAHDQVSCFYDPQ